MPLTVEELQAQVDALAKERDDLKGGIHPSYEARLKNEAANYRTQLDAVTKERDELKEFKTKTEQVELEKKGEYDKAREIFEREKKALEKKVADTEAARVRDKIAAKLETAAVKAGIIDVNDVASVDIADLRLADDGTIPGLDEKIVKLKESKPHWFKADGEGGGGERPGASPGASGGTGGNRDLGKIDWNTIPEDQLDAKLNAILTV